MNAQAEGFGLVIPMPRSAFSHLGKVVYIDERGVVRSVGSLFDDVHFKNLVDQSSQTLDRTTTELHLPSVTVAFTTGGMEVNPLTEEENSAYVIPRVRGTKANNW
jgi:hypothetical protein